MVKKTRSKNKPFFFEEILKVLSKNTGVALNYKQIAAKLKVTDKSQRLLIVSVLADLKAQGHVAEIGRGKFKILFKDMLITGKVDMTASGKAFIVSEDMEEDVVVAPKKTLNALHGDTVEVRVYSKKRGQPEGEIIKVLERNKTSFVGTVQVSPKFAFLVPSSLKTGTDIYIPLNKINGAKDGQKAIAKITEWPKNGVNPIGEITEVLGNVGENDTEMHAILAEYGLPYKFPDGVEDLSLIHI